jgi:hypothetical protein
VAAEAEQVLGAVEARQAWEEGRRMSVAQAVAYALEVGIPTTSA